MHRFLECYDFASHASMQTQLDDMCQKGYLSSNQRDLLLEDKLEKFLVTPLAGRMGVAAEADELYKEKPFVMSVAPGELFLDAKENNDSLLVQGIIDVFFVEDGGIVLLDYKTDRVSSAQELLNRYQIHLQFYGSALERSLNLPVKEILIYSFALEETISI